MKAMLKLFAAVCFLMFGANAAQAAVTCSSVTSSGLTWYYVNGTTFGVQLSYTLTCNRALTTDPTTLAYSNNVNNGQNGDRVQLSIGNANYRLNYNLYLSSCGGTKWSNKNPTNIDGTITWLPSETGVKTDTEYYWACVTAGQTATQAGWYTDSVTMTVKNAAGSPAVNITGTIPIAIYAPSTCAISSAPGTISISYTSFTGAAATGTTSFQATCTSGMPFTIDVSPATGTLMGVDYTVAPDTTAATGTGSALTIGITATAAPGQAGTCAAATCSATATHTLTITY
jgi:hypothetical protein